MEYISKGNRERHFHGQGGGRAWLCGQVERHLLNSEMGGDLILLLHFFNKTSHISFFSKRAS